MQNIPPYVPAQWYKPWEYVARSYADFVEVISDINRLNPHRNFLWRGATNSRWSLKSSLHRHVEGNRILSEPLSFASEMEIERARMQHTAFVEWRLKAGNELDKLASLQHMGAKTELVDVTRSAFIAAWFAAEDSENKNAEMSDGRVFAFGFDRDPDSDYLISDLGFPWSLVSSEPQPAENSTRNLYQFTPTSGLHGWIEAQQASFLLAPPFDVGQARNNGTFPRSPWVAKSWPGAEIRRSIGFNVPFQAAYAPMLPDAAGTVSMYSIRILKNAKLEIMENLRRMHGIQRASLFPGLEGFAHYLRMAQGNNLPVSIHDRDVCYL